MASGRRLQDNRLQQSTSRPKAVEVLKAFNFSHPRTGDFTFLSEGHYCPYKSRLWRPNLPVYKVGQILLVP
ncbi:hypothetical protein Taro_022941 [Colocasia esculenta]|uniref:Uncharacterized protein n=1 Tax=Colocasia esculenta TaxID=4460 RepID=A0A843VFX3_COLES|nr:hypothetical protein [Colocasia esculenta]